MMLLSNMLWICVSTSSLKWAGMRLSGIFTGEPVLECNDMCLMGVWNQWNGMVEWTTGMEYWNEKSFHLHIIYSVV